MQQETARIYRARRALNGLLLLDKPAGLTSNQALQQVKRLFRAKKAGHGGTLDAPATGALPIMFGRYTKLMEHLLNARKLYLARIKLGLKTATADAAGEVLEKREVPPLSDEAIAACLRQFTGKIMQTPPIYSALKHQGKRLYKYALAGERPPIEPRQVEVHSIELLERGPDYLVIKAQCSRGTYIRTLGEDIGEQLGCGAHVDNLRRLELSILPAARMVELAKLEQTPFEQLDSFLVPPNEIKITPAKPPAAKPPA